MTRDHVLNQRGDARYRAVIDWLVQDCRELQGQITPRKVREGVWNQNASAAFLPEQHHVNEVLAALDDETRGVVAWIAEESFVAGVHQALVALHAFEVVPFDDGVEGTPFHDFIGRLHGWDWPD